MRDILLTRSEKGMSYFAAGEPPFHLATVAQAVFDVSGAGDTVVAVLAASLAAGVPMHEALRMANHAAGIVVSKLGTATVSRDELAESLAADSASPSVDDGRLLTREALVDAAGRLGARAADGRLRQRLLRPSAPRPCRADPARPPNIATGSCWRSIRTLRWGA